MKILIFQKELAQADHLKDLFEALGYAVKWTDVSSKEALTIVDKNATELSILDIEMKENRADRGPSKTINPKDKVIVLTSNSKLTDTPIARTNSSCQSKNQDTYFDKGEASTANQTTYQGVIGQTEIKKEMKSSHGILFKDSLFIRSNSLLVKLKFEDIIYLEADANYTQVFTNEKKYIIRASMKDMEGKLDDKRFSRIHKSFLINLEKIESIQADSIQIAGKEIPIGRPQYSWLLRQIKIL